METHRNGPYDKILVDQDLEAISSNLPLNTATLLLYNKILDIFSYELGNRAGSVTATIEFCCLFKHRGGA